MDQNGLHPEIQKNIMYKYEMYTCCKSSKKYDRPDREIVPLE